MFQKHIPDEQIAQDIKRKLGDTPGIPYSEIAKKALECGRTQLAVSVSMLVLIMGEVEDCIKRKLRDTRSKQYYFQLDK